jgi:hypothetical protein
MDVHNTEGISAVHLQCTRFIHTHVLSDDMYLKNLFPRVLSSYLTHVVLKGPKGIHASKCVRQSELS